jgi:Xaa-Pro aminopeptidase
MEFAGKDWPDKISDLRSSLSAAGHTAIVVSELDEIAWLFNLRGEGNTTSSVNV